MHSNDQQEVKQLLLDNKILELFMMDHILLPIQVQQQVLPFIVMRL